MCSARRAVTVLLALGLALSAPERVAARQAGEAGVSVGLVAPAPGGEQTPLSAERALLTARLDSLLPLVEEAEAALRARTLVTEEQAREAAATIARVDTLRVALLTVITPVEQAETARMLFTEVWNEHFGRVDASPSLEENTFTFQWSDERVPIHVWSASRAVELARRTSRSRVKAAIRGQIGGALVQDLHRAVPRLANWVAADPFRPQDHAAAYRMAATSRSRASRSCLAGDLQACADALGLGVERGEQQIRTWYTPEERRMIVEGAIPPERLETSSRARCLERADYEACDEVIQSVPRDWTPLGGPVRETVLAYALERGGRGAWTRLLSNPEMEPVEALEHASGLSIEELLAGWHALLLESRRASFENLVPSSGRSLAWILLFAALALRSTRWRFA